MLLLACNGADGSTTFTDASLTTPHTVTAVGNAQIKTADSKFGGASGYLDGTGDWLTIPDNADFDFSAGNFCLDGWFKVTNLSAIRSLMGQRTDAARYWEWYINTNGSLSFKIFTSPSTAWSGPVAKSLNDAVIPTVANNFFYECTVAGTTGAGEPAWPTTVGSTVVDGTVTWICRKVVNITYSTAASAVVAGVWTHIEFDEDGDNKYIFVNGILKNAFNDTNKVAEMHTGVLYIGANSSGTNPYFGYFDEIRISNVTRHTITFEPETTAYSTQQICTMRVGNVMPIQKIKYYVVTPNTLTSTASVYYWDGSDWAICTNIVDGTSLAGKSMAQTGSISFDSTEDIAKPSVINGVLGYWFKVVVSSVPGTTTISQVTVDEPFQKMRDIWDGVPRTAASVQKYVATDFLSVVVNKYEDNTINVLEDRFTWDETVKGDESSYMKLGKAPTTSFLVLGFTERITGVQLKFIPGKENKNIAQISVDYWDGSAWITIGNIIDGTYTKTNATFGQSGYITWNPIEENIEFRTNVGKEDKLYYYKLKWSAEFSGNEDTSLPAGSDARKNSVAYGVLCYHINGIPVQKKINPYKFSLLAQNRLWLFNNIYENKNEAIRTRLNTYNVFNGKDAGDPLTFGDNLEVVAAKELFVRYTSGVAGSVIVCKKNATFVVEGDNPENTKRVQLSDAIGCIAPETMKASPVGLEYTPLQAHQILIWQGAAGIYYYNGNAILLISDNIANYFDTKKPEYINVLATHKSVGFFDDVRLEYHWCFASGTSTTLNKELVWDLRRQKWYEINRGTGKALQCGVSVHDSNGVPYAYGSIDTGYLERLGNGNTFDGNDIAVEIQTPDIALNQGSVSFDTKIRTVILPQVAKTVTTNNIVCTHTGDGAVSTTVFNLSPKRLNHRIAIPGETVNLGDYIFHNLKFNLTTNNETVPFEPLYLGINFEIVRQKTR